MPSRSSGRKNFCALAGRNVIRGRLSLLGAVQVLVFALCAVITACFTYEIAVIKPNWLDILKGLIPKPSVTCRQSQV